MPVIQLLPTPANQLGESPFWHPHERCLYWIDIPACKVLRFDAATQRTQTFDLPGEPGAIAPVLHNGMATTQLIVALRGGIYLLHTTSGLLAKLLEAPYDTTKFRFNDGVCDARGRLWAGAMYEPRDQELGALWCIRWQGGHCVAEQKAQGNITTNGLAFSPDQRMLYWAHTRAHRIDCFDAQAAQGTLSNRRPFKQFSVQTPGVPYGGRPDGAAVDAQGNLWCALYEGSAVVQLSPAGEELQRIALPVSKPTMPCFGGDDLKTLFITSAHSDEPLGGGVLQLQMDTPGLPVQWFRMESLRHKAQYPCGFSGENV
jgi:sugar lactone lactonase YvrE